MKNISLPGIHHTAKFFVIQLFVPRDVKSGKSCLDLMVDWIGLNCRAIIIYIVHTSNLSFFVHGQNFWKIKFTPKFTQ